MRTLNLGILAHVDAGKTSLTERLLFEAGVLDEIGSVDAGSTQTDTLALERRRGITIKTAVATFVVDGVTVNLVDTPGHPDFIAEVERVLDVLDGVVLVVSAVEGVQAQTRVLMRALQRLHLPTIVYVNKIDRAGAREGELLSELDDRLGGGMIAVQRVSSIGSRTADVSGALDEARFAASALEVLAGNDDRLLEQYVSAGALSTPRLRAEIGAQTEQALVRPVFFGSAITGAGVAELMAGAIELLPVADSPDLDSASAERPSATIFKIDRGPAGEKVSYLRMRAGVLRTRDRVTLCGRNEAKVTAIRASAPGGFVRRDVLLAGEIGTVTGLGEARIGDVFGAVPGDGRRPGSTWHFSPPTLETVVTPGPGSDGRALHTALTELAEADPLIGLRSNAAGELVVSLYGEVQKEVLEATLLERGIEVGFTTSTTVCIERLTGTGSAVEHIYADGNPFLATIGLRAEPAPPGAGIDFRLEIELGSMPLAFLTAVEATVRETLRQGLRGWDVPDCVVTMTHGKYAPRQSAMHANFDKSMSSTGADFRGLTPLVLMSALKAAGTAVHEPLHQFRLEIPADTYGTVLPVLTKLGGIPQQPTPDRAGYRISGVIPAAAVHGMYQALPELTRGEALLETSFDSYRPVAGRAPARARTGPDPLHRRQYLMAVLRGL
ncbi:GTP-binding protein [Nakamurella sp. GG22]